MLFNTRQACHFATLGMSPPEDGRRVEHSFGIWCCREIIMLHCHQWKASKKLK